uniref:Uncharacterized protein n=1 Tax=Seriola lalandi dorsalis TaxID=1841481 RepID=A0A3B4YNM4_SERLL
MVEGKPYRCGLIAAGLCVAAVGLFIMTQERPHVYATMCVLGVSMVCVGTVWSLCQCYPKVDTECVLGRKNRIRAADKLVYEGYCSRSSSRLLPEAPKSQSHSCPTLHLV